MTYTRTASVDSRGSKPTLVAVDSGTVSFCRIEHELKKRYGEVYEWSKAHRPAFEEIRVVLRLRTGGRNGERSTQKWPA